MLWSFDLDGVLAAPPLGWNPAINRDVSLEPIDSELNLQQPGNRLVDWLLEASWYRARYLLRPPREGAIDAVRAAAARGRVIVLTGRHERGRRQTEAWLDRHGFSPFIDALVMNGSSLKSARYKEANLRARGAALHVDDDAATAALLARNGVRVGLVSWPRNRDLEFPELVIRCEDLDSVRLLIEEVADDD